MNHAIITLLEEKRKLKVTLKITEGKGRKELNRRYIDVCNALNTLNLPVVIGSSFEDDTIQGITEGKQYTVTYEGKDEIQVINDFGEKAEYSKNCFKNYL